MHEPGYGERMMAQGKRTPFSSPQCLFAASVSTEDCDLCGATEGFGPSETLCCRSHTRIYWLPLTWLVIKQQLQHWGLFHIKRIH